VKKIGFWSLVLLGTFGWSAASRERNINLEYKPNIQGQAVPGTVPGSKIFFGEFRDQRANPRQVGREPRG